LRGAAGLVTVNSTLGVAALHHGIPVKALGNAVFDVAGLTSPLPLDAFWHDPRPPDPALMADFLRALIGATQVSGGYYARASQDCAIAGFVERLERGIHPLPPLNAAKLALAPRPVAHRVVVTGVTGAVGAALARACAEPGVGLRLIGPAPAELDRIADDCRRRGAVVETVPASGAAVNLTGAADLLIVHAGATEEPDIAAVLAAARAEAAAMRWRGSGAIALVGGCAGSATAALREGCVALRRDLRRHGVALTVVAPSAAAHRIAMRWRAPRFAAIDPDRLAAAVLRAVRRRRAAIALPRAATLVGRAARLMLRALWEAGRGMLASGAAERTPLPGGSGPGD
jgi:short-subunit dehydrogenase